MLALLILIMVGSDGDDILDVLYDVMTDRCV